jgi:hypothetical protein
VKTPELDTIYAQMAEHCTQSIRPHSTVMGFVYDSERRIPAAGGISLFYDMPYISTAADTARLDVVNFMHDNYLLVDRLIKLYPAGEGKLPGLMMTWRPIDGPAKISEYVVDYVSNLQLNGPDDIGITSGGSREA